MTRKTKKQKIISDYRKKIKFSKILKIQKVKNEEKNNNLDNIESRNEDLNQSSKNKLIMKNYLKSDLKKSFIITIIILLIQAIIFYLLIINQNL